MSAQALAVLKSGLVTSVGLSAPAACAAIRAKLTNPTPTRFVDSAGEWIMSHAVALDRPMRGLTKLAHMAAMAVQECLEDVPEEDWARIPVLLCVAERARPGRFEGLETQLPAEIRALLGPGRWAEQMFLVPHGRVSCSIGLLQARQLIYEGSAPAVLIVAVDSLLTWPTLRVLEKQQRLLTNTNSNGFIPGEAAAAVLVGRPVRSPCLSIEGLGFAHEAASIESEEPLRAEGLTAAIKAALGDAGCEMHDLDFRIVDIAGEQYYFKEASLALSRTLRQRKAEFDIWHPAECVGEVGSAIGPMLLALADAACRKNYAPGPSILIHSGSDAGHRSAVVARFRGH